MSSMIANHEMSLQGHTRPLSEVIPTIPDWLEEIINRLLAKRPDNRYQTADKMAKVL